jgi:hypothetical protein
MFRYASPGNYYRFAINRQIGYRRLMRLIDGAATLLWEDNWRYQYNQPYELQVERRGNEISLRQDGVLLTAVADNNHSQGRVALYSYAQTSAFTPARSVRVIRHNSDRMAYFFSHFLFRFHYSSCRKWARNGSLFSVRFNVI